LQASLSSSSADGGTIEASSLGCLSVLLYPFISVPLFGALLFWGLSQIALPGAASPQPAPAAEGQLAAFFAPPVLRWEARIVEWAAAYELDPNLVATVMQIESCGDPGALSRAGAIGLFQVMPYHFAEGEDSYAPAINAQRGLAYLAKALETYEQDPGMALAAYNGGINGASRPANEWAQETQDYYYWGTNIYGDAQADLDRSAVLEEWMGRGGASLCAQAEQRLAQLP